jgi:hypothetical protein
MTCVLPFRLRVPGKDEFHGLRAVSISYRFNGVMRLEGALLVIEWQGAAQVQDVGALSVRDDRLALPDERLTVPASDLYRATLAGGWWRPRLTLQAKAQRALAIVPSEDHGTVHFWYARRDRAPAIAMEAALSAAIAAPEGARHDVAPYHPPPKLRGHPPEHR